LNCNVTPHTGINSLAGAGDQLTTTINTDDDNGDDSGELAANWELISTGPVRLGTGVNGVLEKVGAANGSNQL